MTEKTLIIAEKPSAAGDIARALGKMRRDKNHFEDDRYVVSSAVGHLLEMAPPEGTEAKRGKWSLTNLPVLPERFDLRPIKTSEDRLRALKKLYNRKDVTAVINACDAGREGELIFLNLMLWLTDGKSGKPAQRLWLQSMTPAAIRRGFERLRAHDEMRPLQHAAVSRAEADWLIGINSTRAMTALHAVAGGFSLTTVGRVQTPTLAMIVEREEQIKAFVPRQYWEIRASFAAQSGVYEGLWRAAGDATKKGDAAKKPERVFDEAQKDAILRACQAGAAGIVSETVKPVSESSPLLFDLTTLQREANGRFGFSARGTLATAQALYERHKMITYPRTDSRALPEDYPQTAKDILRALSDDPDLGEHAKRVLTEQWARPGDKRVFNNAKVSDHFAIIPTGENKRDSLRDNERKLYDFIARRFVAVFYPPAKFLATERKTLVGEHGFVSKGRIMQDPGWRAVAATASKDTELPPVKDGEEVSLSEIRAEDKMTAPPARYNEATLLSAMESAGKLVDDEDLREAMRERGLGTPATRAAIIEGLLREGYLVRDRRDLAPMPKAHSLIRLLSALKADELTKPALTGEWEHKLRRIEKEGGDRDAFMDDIRALTATIVMAAKNCGDVENIPGDFALLEAACPVCGGKTREKHRRFACEKCEFFVWKAMGGREFSVVEAEKLLADGETGELPGFRSRLGREYAANVVLRKNEDGVLRATFDFAAAETTTMDPAAVAEMEEIGPCPKCAAKVRDTGARYLCERGIGEKPECEFSIAKRILQQEISAEQMRLLLSEGKTATLTNFISKKNNRPFRARLALDLSDKSGKLSFEFEPRAPKRAAKK